jgi:hypothetical protein
MPLRDVPELYVEPVVQLPAVASAFHDRKVYPVRVAAGKVSVDSTWYDFEDMSAPPLASNVMV